MKRRRALLLFLTIAVVLIAASSPWLWQAKRQYARNRQLIAALVHNDTKQALVLIEEGSDPNTRLYAPPAPGLSELLRQFLHHQLPAVDSSPTAFLLACGADWERRAGTRNDTLEHPDNLVLVQTMFLHGANLHAQSLGEDSALNMAVTTNQPRVAEWLLEHGANVNVPDKLGWTLLMRALLSSHRDMMLNSRRDLVFVLLAHGADVNARNQWGDTALFLAVGNGLEKDGYVKVFL